MHEARLAAPAPEFRAREDVRQGTPLPRLEPGFWYPQPAYLPATFAQRLGNGLGIAALTIVVNLGLRLIHSLPPVSIFAGVALGTLVLAVILLVMARRDDDDGIPEGATGMVGGLALKLYDPDLPLGADTGVAYLDGDTLVWVGKHCSFRLGGQDVRWGGLTLGAKRPAKAGADELLSVGPEGEIVGLVFEDRSEVLLAPKRGRRFKAALKAWASRRPIERGPRQSPPTVRQSWIRPHRPSPDRYRTALGMWPILFVYVVGTNGHRLALGPHIGVLIALGLTCALWADRKLHP